jgi:hypothetical protein
MAGQGLAVPDNVRSTRTMSGPRADPRVFKPPIIASLCSPP